MLTTKQEHLIKWLASQRGKSPEQFLNELLADALVASAYADGAVKRLVQQNGLKK